MSSLITHCISAYLWLPKIASGLAQLPRWVTLIAGMIDLLKLLGGLLVGVFRSHAAREAEMAFSASSLLCCSDPRRRGSGCALQIA
jgi:hypothetical protein